jgi:hypothetical protein
MEPPGSRSHGPLNPQQLLELALRRLREGTLSREHQPRLFAGHGRQDCCSLCSEAIGPEDIEYEVETTDDGTAAQQLRFHRPCYYAWLQACGSEPDPR